MMLFQGVAEVIRCVICLRTGEWPQRLHDVEELESAILADEQARARLNEQRATGGATP
jgi:hypothetical protein